MTQRRKKISEQVIVITGASSGIGLVTAKRAAACGAKVVLAARNERDLERAVHDITAAGGRAIAVPTDTSDVIQVERLALRAIDAFGRIDTWINNAAVSMYGRLEEVPLEDARRQLDVNFWGYVHGSLTALQHMRARGGGIVNVTSALADRAIPLQGYYCAAKHAVKAFTDTLRMELEAEGLEITVSQVKPGSTDTPFFEKARTYLDVEPQPVPPVYAPEVVADAILESAQRPVRELIAGGAGARLSAARFVPRLADRYMERWTFAGQRTTIPATNRPDNLYAPVAHDGGERGRLWHGHTRGSSVYTHAMLHPASAAMLVGLVAATAALLSRRTRRAA